MLSPDLLALLCCPRCHSGLQLENESGLLRCPSCAATYEVKDGIPVLIPPSSAGAPRD